MFIWNGTFVIETLQIVGIRLGIQLAESANYEGTILPDLGATMCKIFPTAQNLILPNVAKGFTRGTALRNS